VLRRAVELDPNDASSWMSLGWALEYQGVETSNEALRAYETAQRIEPDLYSQRGIADLLFRRGDLEQAQQEYQDVLKAAEQNVGSADRSEFMGWCHYRLREYELAVRCFMDVLDVDRDHVVSQFDLALTLLASRRLPLAVREYHRALELTKNHQARRQRGILAVALDDLRVSDKGDAIFTGLPEWREIEELLQRALDDSSRRDAVHTATDRR
jgi:tetratricopeptide (TPR) repeat protein